MIEQLNAREELSKVNIKATGIGSVPHKDAEYICRLILEAFPDIPYAPQLTKSDPREDMFLQYSENLPCLKADIENRKIVFDASVNKEEKMTEFYEHVLGNQYDYFKITREYSRGFYTLIDMAKNRQNKFIKCQVIGPVTFLSSVLGGNNRALLHDEMLSEAIVLGLAMKGLWQAKEIRKIGKIPVVFYDEPSLSGIGSAYMPIGKGRVTSMINTMIDFIKERDDILIGMHCCGNSDWETLLETKIDIISFDSFGFAKNFALYPANIKKFLERNGIIAFGAVPTSEYNESINLDNIHSGFSKLIEELVKKGISEELLKKNMLITPACGMSLLHIKAAENIIALTGNLAKRVSNISV